MDDPKLRCNVRVCCRFRPMNKLEESEGAKKIVRVKKDCMSCIIDEGRYKALTFTYDRVFPVETTQEEVYKHTGAQLVEQVLAGYNCTIFAYGQTGSGKTYTMEGGSDDNGDSKGMIPRMVEDLMESMRVADNDLQFTIQVSYVEIYMERIRDLLDPQNEKPKRRSGRPETMQARRKRVNTVTEPKIKESPERGIYLAGVTEPFVRDLEDFNQLLQDGNIYRAVSKTQMNAQSSRSHAVITLRLACKSLENGTEKSSKLMMVDLAGSEKNKSKSNRARLEEAKKINQSLSTLGRVINALTEKKNHIPHRESKLTRLLADSLGGNSQTCLIITCSPSSYNREETKSTLRFGQRAKTIKNKPKVNKVMTVEQYKKKLQRAENQIARQDIIIKEMKQDIMKACERLKSRGVSPCSIMKSKYFSPVEKPGGGRQQQSRPGTQTQESEPSEDTSLPGTASNVSTDNEEKLIELQEAKKKLMAEIADLQTDLENEQQSAVAYRAQIDELSAQLQESEANEASLIEQLEHFKMFNQKLELRETESKSDEQLIFGASEFDGKKVLMHSDSVSDMKEKYFEEGSIKGSAWSGNLEHLNPERWNFSTEKVEQLKQQCQEAFEVLTKTSIEKKEVEERFLEYQNDINGSKHNANENELLGRLLYQSRQVSKLLASILREKERLSRQVIIQAKTLKFNEALRKNSHSQLAHLEKAVRLGHQLRADERNKYLRDISEKDSELERVRMLLRNLNKPASPVRPPGVSVPVRRPANDRRLASGRRVGGVSVPVRRSLAAAVSGRKR